PGDAAYMIVSGQCRAFHTVGDRRETLAVMDRGDVVGEMALVLDAPRAASVEAVDRVTVLVLDRATMTEGLGTDGWTGALVRALAGRFRDLEEQVRKAGLRRGGWSWPEPGRSPRLSGSPPHSGGRGCCTRWTCPRA